MCIIIFILLPIFLPSAWLKGGRALKGHEWEQKENNKIEVEILLEIKYKKF